MTETWRDDAACRGVDMTAWDLPDGQGATLTDDNRAAIRVCHRCPVLAECAREVLDAYARGDEELVGVIRAGVPLRMGINFRYLSTITRAKLRAVAGEAA